MLSVLSSKLAEEPPLFWIAHRHQESLEWPYPRSGAGLAQVPLESFQSDKRSPSNRMGSHLGSVCWLAGDSPALQIPGQVMLANSFLPRAFLVCCSRSLWHLEEQSHQAVTVLTLLSHCFAQAQGVALPLWWEWGSHFQSTSPPAPLNQPLRADGGKLGPAGLWPTARAPARCILSSIRQLCLSSVWISLDETQDPSWDFGFQSGAFRQDRVTSRSLRVCHWKSREALSWPQGWGARRQPTEVIRSSLLSAFPRAIEIFPNFAHTCEALRSCGNWDAYWTGQTRLLCWSQRQGSNTKYPLMISCYQCPAQAKAPVCV